jgi:hypothetical protein
VFDDPGQPDFVLDLWLPEDAGRRDELPPDEAIAEANRWLARIESLLRRPAARRQAAPEASPSASPEPPPVSRPSRTAAAPYDLNEAVDDDEKPII